MPSTLAGGTGKERKGERKQALKPETRSQADVDSQPDFKRLDSENTDRYIYKLYIILKKHCNSCNSGEFAKKTLIYNCHTEDFKDFCWFDFAGVSREFF